MSIQQLLLGGSSSSDVIVLLGCSESDLVGVPSGAFVAYSIDSAGVESGISGVTTSFTNQAVTPSIHTNLYEVRLTGSGTTPTGSSLNSWLALSSPRSWSFTQNVEGSSSFSGTIEIRAIGSSTTITSASVTLSATVIP